MRVFYFLTILLYLTECTNTTDRRQNINPFNPFSNMDNVVNGKLVFYRPAMQLDTANTTTSTVSSTVTKTNATSTVNIVTTPTYTTLITAEETTAKVVIPSTVKFTPSSKDVLRHWADIVSNPLSHTTFRYAIQTTQTLAPERVEAKQPNPVKTVEAKEGVAETENQNVCYDNAIVMRAHLDNYEDLKFMKKLQRSNDIQLWGAGAYYMDFLVHRSNREIVEEKLKDRHENYTCILTNMKPLLLKQRFEHVRTASRDDLTKFIFKKYVSLETIDALFERLVRIYPNIAETVNIGQSQEDRSIIGIRINKQNSTKAMVVVGGIHGRDWASITSVLHVLGYLVTEDDEQKNEIFDSLDWYFIPVLNPDGYLYTRKYDRFWMKNRRKNGKCYGVDLNSNFGKHWDTNTLIKRSTNICDADYPGTAAFSEKETKGLRDFIARLMQTETVVGFIDVQSYGQTITYPWSGLPRTTDHWHDHSTYAQGMRQNIFSQTSARYTFAPSYDVPYPRPGLSIDWAYSIGITHSYIIETRDTGQFGYLLPNSQIEGAGTDVVQALKSLARRIHIN